MKVDLAAAKTAYIVGAELKDYKNDLPTWVNPLDLDEFDGIRTNVISPIHFLVGEWSQEACAPCNGVP